MSRAVFVAQKPLSYAMPELGGFIDWHDIILNIVVRVYDCRKTTFALGERRIIYLNVATSKEWMCSDAYSTNDHPLFSLVDLLRTLCFGKTST